MSTKSTRKEIPKFGMLKSSPDTDLRYRDEAPGAQEVIFWEEGNPRCLINLVSNRMREVMLALPPHYHTIPIHEIERSIAPTEMDDHLRIAFWDEYTIACDNKKPMRVTNIYQNICSREYFYAWILDQPLRLAYMIRPPQEYMLRMRSLLDMGLKRFEEILRLPIMTKKVMPNGSSVRVVDTKLIGEMVKIVALVDNRVKGSVVQKVQIDQKSINMNMNYEAPKSYDEIQKELRATQKEIRQLSGDTPIDDFLDPTTERTEDIEFVEQRDSGTEEEGT